MGPVRVLQVQEYLFESSGRRRWYPIRGGMLVEGTKGFTYGHTPSSSSLVISPQRSACPTSCSEASDTSPPTNRRFATVRPRLVAGLFHQKGGLSSVEDGCYKLWCVSGRGVCVYRVKFR